MKIITWNLNSVKVRKERLLAILVRHQPDALCLQELKCEDHAFPTEECKSIGYESALYGQKTYNGVAILSRVPLQDVRRGLEENDAQSRLIAGTLNGVTVYSAYFPNGGEPESEKFVYKLDWMKRLRRTLDVRHKATDLVALCGDFNVAPSDLDIRNPGTWRETVLVRDDVRAALNEVRAFGLCDTLREKKPDLQVFSWWDYRNLGFPKNDGLRIDHIDVTEPLVSKLVDVVVDREERKGKQPSDHAPVIATFDL